MATDRVIFVFSGQGSQYYQMGADLYTSHRRFRFWMDHMDEVCQDLLQISIVDVLYRQGHRVGDEFIRTSYTHPAIFMVEYSLARALIDENIVPDYLLGAGLGEYVAMALSGVCDATKILALIISHGLAVEEKCEPGGMVCILDNPSLYDKVSLIRENSKIVSINYDHHFVISGFQTPIKKICSWLRQNQKIFMKLPVSHGFHSPNTEPAIDDLKKNLKLSSFEVPEISLISCTTGEQLGRPGYEHFLDIVRKRIRFQKAIETLFKDRHYRYHIVDVGPFGTYTGFIRQNRQWLDREFRLYDIMTPLGCGMKNFEKIKDRLSSFKKAHKKQADWKSTIHFNNKDEASLV